MKIIMKIILVTMLGLLFVSCGTKSTRAEDEQVATPAFSTSGGTFDAAVDVLISCTTANAVIRYTLDDTEPGSSSAIYNSVLHIASNTTLKAKAYKSGWISSSTRAAIYVFTATAAPVLSPPGATYTTEQMVTMTCETPGAQIRYTTDGSLPTETSALYTSPITISTASTLRAIAFVVGKTPSAVTTEVYNLQVQAPVFDPAGSDFPSAQLVTITSPTVGAIINYTLDGSEPTETSPVYTHPLNITTNTWIKAKAHKTGWNPSPVTASAYQINVADQMVYVPSGTFHNGVANVSLSPYYISKYEVTQFDWLFIMGTDPSFYPEDIESPIADLPVENVTWFDAIEYCNWRSVSEGYTPAYSYSGLGTNPSMWPPAWNADNANHSNIICDWTANGYRLPTEMEWMFAARGGNYSLGYLYSGSNNVGEVAWYGGNNAEMTSLVGLKLPNELGIYDMSGNVWEFCWDIFGPPYPNTDQVNPVGAASGTSRVIRGGSFQQDASNCTIARRFNLLPLSQTNIVGLRVVRKAL